MIPVRIEMQDFLSYRHPQPIDFTGFEVACLSGNNGQGKSTILDGMTWAVWGCARGCEGGQNQERLIRDGAERTSVHFDFELGGELYRVVRTRARTGKAELQFLVRHGASWTNLAGESLRETEARIAQTVRMDYRTFVASAFLLQGRADDFLTRMKPEERKDVFARLLDLGTYERLEDAAKSYARDAEGLRKSHAERTETLTQECASLEGVPDELAAAEAGRCAAADALAAAEQELEARRTELTRLEQTLAVVSQLRDSLRELEARLAADQAGLRAKHEELDAIDALLARRAEVEAALGEAARLGNEDAGLQETARAKAELETKRAELAGAIDAERAAIEARQTERARSIATLEKQIHELEAMQPKLAEFERLLEESAGVERSVDEAANQLSALRAEHAEIRAHLDRMLAHEAQLATRIDVAKHGDGACPVCGAELDQTQRKRIVRDLRAEAAGASEDRKRLDARRAEVEKEGKRVGEDERRLRKVLDQRQRAAGAAEQLRARLARLASDRTAVEALGLQDAADAALLQQGSFAPALRDALARVDAELAALAYDRAAHDAVRARLAELAGFRALDGRIAEAAGRRDHVSGEARELRDRLVRDEASIVARRTELHMLEGAVSSEPAVRARVEEAASHAASAAGDLRGAEAAVVRLTERADVLDRRRAELESVRAAELAAAADRRRYLRLAQAFGRGGIPDLIIENALPELREDANTILAQLTDCEMSLDFRMRTETKAGKPKETFDVLVYHDGGVRDYQMFSGGEAFRIAFAIRLGLSKLLVRRAGARLETLVVDEGFGSQDAEGRERLVEAINLARREFRKVLVITHLEDLKDVFGAQIHVTKDGRDGSSVRVVAG